MKNLLKNLGLFLTLTITTLAQTLSLNSSSYSPGDNITASWSSGSGNGKDWIAIYPAGITPSNNPGASTWLYIGGTQNSKKKGPKNGSVTFNSPSLSSGSYSAYYLLNDGYSIGSGPINFSVGSSGPTVATSQNSYNTGETITVNFTTGPGNSLDWIGIYTPGQTPASGTPATQWIYTGGNTTGSVSFTGNLPAGNYITYFLENDGYNILAGPSAFTVTQNNGGGGSPTVSTTQSSYEIGTNITVNFANGPANASDWIGIYPQGSTPSGTNLKKWLYTNGTKSSGNGLSTGSVSFYTDLPTGNYSAYFLENDGYSILSGPATFTVTAPPGPATPIWVKTSFKRRHATSSTPYSGKISAYASDPNAGDTLTFTKTNGPAWLNVASNGTLSGTPATSDAGTNTFTLRATDLGGNNASATMTIQVYTQGNEQINSVNTMSYNFWHGFGKVNNGYRKGLDSIILSGADIIATQESTDNQNSGINRAIQIANDLGWHYNTSSATDDIVIISRYPITQNYSLSLANGAKIQLTPTQEIIAFNIHLDHNYYGPYAAHANRSTVNKTLHEENSSQRDEQIATAMNEMQPYLNNASNTPVLLLGDFNAPSHLDYNDDTAYAHGGLGYIPWPTSIACTNAGLIDTFRAINSDPLNTPGNTWSPVYNGTEPQDRIDFIYYKGNKLTPTASDMFTLTVENTINAYGGDSSVVGPNTWPSDHSAVRTTFSIQP